MSFRRIIQGFVGCFLALTVIGLLLVPMSSAPARGQEPNERQNHGRMPEPDGPTHSEQLVNLDKTGVLMESASQVSMSTTDILVVTGGSGPLTGISPIQEKEFWLDVLAAMPGTSIDWYDGVPAFGLLDQYDLVIFDAGGYWYPLGESIDTLKQYHETGRPLIVVAPDINYDVDYGSLSMSLVTEVLHIDGALGVLPESEYYVYAGTGNPIEAGLPEQIFVPSETSYPDSFDPSTDANLALMNSFAFTTEFGVGSCAGLPEYSIYNPLGLSSIVTYPGSQVEGAVVTFGIPLLGLKENVRQVLANNTITYALGIQSESSLLISELNGLRSMLHAVFNASADTLAEVMFKVIHEEEAAAVELIGNLLLFAIGEFVPVVPDELYDFADVTQDATMAMIDGLDFTALKATELWTKGMLEKLIDYLANMDPDNGMSSLKSFLVEQYLSEYEQAFDDQYAELIQQIQQSPPAPETLISMKEQVGRFTKWMENVCYQEDDLVYFSPTGGEARTAAAGAIYGYVTQVDDTIHMYDVINDSITKTKYIVWGGAIALKAAGWLCTGAGVPVGPLTEHTGLLMIKGASVASVVAKTLTFATECDALSDIAADAYNTFAADVITLCTTYEAALDLMDDFPEEITGEFKVDAIDPSNPQCIADPPNIEPTSPWTAEIGVDVRLTSPVASTGTVLLEVIHEDEVLSMATYGGIDLEPNQTEYLTYTLPFPIPLLSYGDEATLSVVCYAGIYGDEGAWISGPKTNLFKVVKPEAYSGYVVSNSVNGELGTGESFSLPLATPDAASTLMISLEYGGSELDMHLYDNQGGHVGMDYATGNIEIGIPGASYSGPKAAHEWISVEGGGLTEYSVEVVCVFSGDKTDFSLSYLFTTSDFSQDEPSPEAGFASLTAEGKLAIVYNFDPFTIVPTAVNGWTWYDPTLPPAQNNLANLRKNTAYWVKVTEECWLTYGTQSYHFAAGWNNPVWSGY